MKYYFVFKLEFSLNFRRPGPRPKNVEKSVKMRSHSYNRILPEGVKSLLRVVSIPCFLEASLFQEVSLCRHDYVAKSAMSFHRPSSEVWDDSLNGRTGGG